MRLTKLVYASEFGPDFKSSDIEDILNASRRNNPLVGITGILTFNRNYFLQCLEGSRTEVNKLYRRILSDPRHANIELIQYADSVQREYSSWSMGYVPETSLTRTIVLKYSTEEKFNPYQMGARSCELLLGELRDSLTII